MPSSIKFSHLQAILFNGFFATLLTGVFLNDYLLRIGFNQYDFGIFYSVIYFNGLIAFPFSFYANSIKRKKKFYLLFHYFALALLLVFIGIPYLFEPGARIVAWLSILCFGLYSVIARIGQIVIMPWMFHVVGNEKWVRFFRLRMAISYIVPIFATLTFGSLLKFHGISILSMMFLIALIAGLLGIICMAFFPENEYERIEETTKEPFRVIFKNILSNRNMIHILLYCTLLSMGIGLFVPAVYPFLINRMGIENTTLSLFQVIMMLTSLASIYGTSKLCERKNSITALNWLSSAVWIVPISLLMLPLSKYLFTGVIFVLGIEFGYGLIYTCVFLALMNVSLQNLPPKNNVVSLAFIELIKSLFMALGSFACGWLVNHVREIHLGTLSLGGYQILFLCSFVCISLHSS